MDPKIAGVRDEPSYIPHDKVSRNSQWYIFGAQVIAREFQMRRLKLDIASSKKLELNSKQTLLKLIVATKNRSDVPVFNCFRMSGDSGNSVVCRPRARFQIRYYRFTLGWREEAARTSIHMAATINSTTGSIIPS